MPRATSSRRDAGRAAPRRAHSHRERIQQQHWSTAYCIRRSVVLHAGWIPNTKPTVSHLTGLRCSVDDLARHASTPPPPYPVVVVSDDAPVAATALARFSPGEVSSSEVSGEVSSSEIWTMSAGLMIDSRWLSAALTSSLKSFGGGSFFCRNLKYLRRRENTPPVLVDHSSSFCAS